MNAAEIAKAPKGHRSGHGDLIRCPAHDDRNPSLSSSDVDGKVLVHCHTDCDQERVNAVVRTRGLWPKKPPVCLRVELYSYFLVPQTLDKLAKRKRMSSVEFVERLLRSGLAVPSGDGLKIWPNGGRP